MKLLTPVEDEKCLTGISYNDRIMMLGSCFSDNIGGQLANFGFNVCINPFGTLYNPVSLLQSMQLLVSDRMFVVEDAVDMGAGSGLYCSFSHHTSFARPSAEEFINDANEALTKARAFFKDCNKVIITLGTSWCFRHLESDRIVSNCLKRPGGEFRRERLSVQEVTDALTRIMGMCPEKDFIFTVSPIRHFKDGAHGNQISKAGLILGIEEAINANTGRKADYFPAYEIMMDELRDYRFYAEDMLHPSPLAVKYIFEKFKLSHISERSFKQMEENMRLTRAENHIQK